MMRGNLRHYLADYADGELDPALRREVEALLAKDADAQAEVQRWQALRQAAQRVVINEAVPVNLAARIRSGLRERAAVRVPRLLRLGAAPLAAAAALILAVTVWPSGAATPSIKAEGFAGVYRSCGVVHQHDTFAVRESLMKGGCPMRALCRIKKGAAFACDVPNVAGCGKYRLVGACECKPRDCTSHVVHVHFRNVEDPSEVISVFAIDRCIHICGKSGKRCENCNTCMRRYEVASVDHVQLVSWRERGASYVLACEKMDQRNLAELADNLRLAMREQLPGELKMIVAGLTPEEGGAAE
jgi:hypothetical protein